MKPKARPCIRLIFASVMRFVPASKQWWLGAVTALIAMTSAALWLSGGSSPLFLAWRDQRPFRRPIAADGRNSFLDGDFRFHLRTAANALMRATAASNDITPTGEEDITHGPAATVFHALLDEYLAPWTGIIDDATGMLSGPLITAEMRTFLSTTSSLLSCCAVVRIVGTRIFARQSVDDAAIPLRFARLNSTVTLLHDALQRYSEQLGPLRLEFMLNTCDHPLTTDNRAGGDRPGIPIFSPSFSGTTLDIPVPDVSDLSRGYFPTDYDMAGLRPWDERTNHAIFLGGANTYPADLHNYAANARIRLKLLAMAHPDLLDVGIHQMQRVAPRLVRNLTAVGAGVSAMAGPAVKFSYKYQVVVAGGIHSGSVCGAMQASQVSIVQDMSQGEYFYPALTPGRHIVPTRRMFQDLPAIVTELQANDAAAHAIAEEAHRLVPMFCSKEGRTLYWAVILQRLQPMMGDANAIRVPTVCSKTLVPPTLPPMIESTVVCNTMTDAQRRVLAAQESNACHHYCVPRSISTDEADWFWAEAPYQ